MKIHFLGTNGWFDTKVGETPCILIDAKEAYIILDAGNSFRKIDYYIKDSKKPIYLFLSHFHLDHTTGLHILLKFSFSQGITIFGQPGTKNTLGKLVAKPFSASFDIVNKKFRIDVQDLAEGKHTIRNLVFECKSLVHADPCFGYSFFLEGKKVTYCTDTGTCKNLVGLANNSDVFITECSWRKRNQYPGWPHLAPEDAAETAKKANVKKLFLTHFVPTEYPEIKDRKDAEKRAKKIFSNTIAAKDDLVVKL